MTARARKSVEQLDAPVVAPPSPPAVVSNAQALMGPSLVQAQTDVATLTSMLNAWPADVPTELQNVVQILLRTVEGIVLVAQASSAMAEAAGLVG